MPQGPLYAVAFCVSTVEVMPEMGFIFAST